MVNSAKGACLVGSVPLRNSASVFDVTGTILGRHLRRIPDGETGERSNWIAWQLQVFENTPQLESLASNLLSIRKEYTAADIDLPALGYSEAAIKSYSVFNEAKAQGRVPAHCRFQVSLPTPLAPIHFYVAPSDQAELEIVYQAKMLQELEEILQVVPPEELAIQWDTAVEFGVLEGVFPTYLDNAQDDIVARLIQLGEAVPQGVDLGFHLCYGDAGHQHFVEPSDTKILVGVANGIAQGLVRALNWLHLPVPRGRNDAAYFAPLRALALQPDTELYLGLVHFSDGVEGANRRIRQASKVVDRFGVATECGFGRRPPASVPELMYLHIAVSEPLV